ncbi:MAG: MBL fold metallo-hydrolase [Thermoprotei archaeon]
MSEVTIQVLGAGGEVGRSGILIKYKERALLLDYGTLTNDEVQFPLHVTPRDLSAVILSHAHLDHSGALPMLYASAKAPPLYSTIMTLELTDILLHDFMNISKSYLPFEEREVQKMFKNSIPVTAGDSIDVDNFHVKFYDAGHIPGSLMVEVEVNNKKILYTGDFNTWETKLLKPAQTPNSEYDLIISESTYSGVEHPPRSDVEKKLIEISTTTIENKGFVLIPAFSVGRSQEILSIFEEHNIPYTIYLDGMAKEVGSLFLQYPSFFRNYSLLKKALERAVWINSNAQRKRIIERPNIVVTPAGMLKGGPAVYYMNKIATINKNLVVLVSYQIPGTPGRRLYDERLWYMPNLKKDVNVAATVEWLDFSSHCGHSQLKSFLTKISTNRILLVHGETQKASILKSELEEHGINVEIANNGYTTKI